MRATVVVLVVMAVAAMASAAVVREKRSYCDCSSCPPRNYGHGMIRLKNQESRIAALSAQVRALEEDKHLPVDMHNSMSALLSRLKQDFGNNCGPKEFCCGGNSHKCINNLEVCDKVKDCPNGHDEDEETCELKPKSGTTWTGGKVFDHCTNRHPYEMKVTFTDYCPQGRNYDWFPIHAHVHATVVLRSKSGGTSTTAALSTHGYYCYARTRLFLNPPEADRLGLELIFNTGDANSVNAYVVRESSGEQCAHFVLYKE